MHPLAHSLIPPSSKTLSYHSGLASIVTSSLTLPGLSILVITLDPLG